MSPSASSTTPEPRPALVRISTTEGRPRWIPLTTSCCTAATAAGPVAPAPAGPVCSELACRGPACPAAPHPGSRPAAGTGPSAPQRGSRLIRRGPTMLAMVAFLPAPGSHDRPVDRCRVEGEAVIGDAHGGQAGQRVRVDGQHREPATGEPAGTSPGAQYLD